MSDSSTSRAIDSALVTIAMFLVLAGGVVGVFVGKWFFTEDPRPVTCHAESPDQFRWCITQIDGPRNIVGSFSGVVQLHEPAQRLDSVAIFGSPR